MEDASAKIGTYYRSLLALKRLFDSRAAGPVAAGAVDALAVEARRIQEDFPGLLPPFEPIDMAGRWAPMTGRYDLDKIRAWLAVSVARLEAPLAPEAAPAPATPSFAFVADPDLRALIERDNGEIQRALRAQCWKSAIILSGGAIEALLTDVVQRDPGALRAPRAPKSPDVSRWGLADLINVAVDLRLVTTAVERLSHPVREYRNLVHPANELRNRLTFDAEEARIAVEVLSIVRRDLAVRSGEGI